MEQTSFLISLDTLQYLVNFTSYFIFSFMGSILKEMYNTNTDTKHEFDPYRVITSTIIASLAALAVKEYFKETLDQYWGIMGIISLILGFVGFELFHHISSIKALNKFVTSIKNGDGVGSDDDDENDAEEKPKKKKKYPELTTMHETLINYHIQRPIIHHPNEKNDENDEDEKK